MAEAVDYLDMHSTGALATTLGHRVKDIYTSRCKLCGGAFINKLGTRGGRGTRCSGATPTAAAAARGGSCAT